MIHKHKDCRGSDGGCPEDCRARSRTWTTEQPGKTDAVSENGKAAAVSIHSGGAKPEAGSLNAVLGILYHSWPFPSHYRVLFRFPHLCLPAVSLCNVFWDQEAATSGSSCSLGKHRLYCCQENLLYLASSFVSRL